MVRSWPPKLFVLFILAAGASCLGAQNTPSKPNALSSWPNVSLNVVVTDKKGEAHKVDSQTFRLFDNGIERPVRLLSSADSPISLAFLIDSSRSINRRRPEMLSAIDAIIHALPPGSEVLAVSFSYQANIDMPFTPASAADHSLLTHPPASGSTALFDALIATEDYISAKANNERRALVIMSDGQDNTSKATVEEARKSIERPGAPTVYACTVRGTKTTGGSSDEANREDKILKLFATSVGGRVFSLDPDPILTASQIAAVIRNQYAIEFTSLDSPPKGSEHKLQLRLSSSDARIYGPKSFFAP